MRCVYLGETGSQKRSATGSASSIDQVLVSEAMVVAFRDPQLTPAQAEARAPVVDGAGRDPLQHAPACASTPSSSAPAPPGLFCAARPASSACAVLLLDHAEKVAEKIRISGGGRCNFTNLDVGAGELRLDESRLLPLGAGPLHAARLHRSGRAPRHRLAREAQGPAVLRRLERADHRPCCSPSATPAASQRWQPCAVDAVRHRRGRRSRSTPRAARSRRRGWSSPPAASRSRRSAPATGATPWPGSSATASSSRGRRWCRWSARARPGSRSRRSPASPCRCASPPAGRAARRRSTRTCCSPTAA